MDSKCVSDLTRRGCMLRVMDVHGGRAVRRASESRHLLFVPRVERGNPSDWLQYTVLEARDMAVADVGAP